MTDTPATRPPDPWTRLRAATNARIGLERAGDALRTRDVLAFQLAHGRARDAVHAPLDVEALAAALPGEPVVVRSRAPDRETYLRRPDLGRRLDPACLPRLTAGDHDLVFVVADGLSATAVQRHAAALVFASLARLEGWRVAPIVIATQARVALGDEIAACLGARLCAMVIGERPGLTVADSLGIYLTWEPRIGRRDSERNCLSNIHPAGLGPEAASAKLAWLLREARARRLTGVGLKDDMALPGAEPAGLCADPA